MANMLQLALRGAEFFFTLINMSLIGNMIATAISGNPSLVNFDMFVTVFAMLSLFYLIAICFKEQFTFHAWVPTALDAINMLLFLIAGIATAAELGVHSCSNGDYTARNHITNGSPNRAGRCREAQAATTFFWFGWACWAFSLFLSVTNSSGVNLRGPRKGPVMSQV